MAFPMVVTEGDRARGRRAVAWEAARELAPQAFLALCFLAALASIHPVACLARLVRP